MTQPPVVPDTASSLRSGFIAIGLGIVALIYGINGEIQQLAVGGVVALGVGGFLIAQGLVRSARNRDAVTKALLEQAQRPEQD